MRSGYVYTAHQRLYDTGNYGNYWSSQAGDSSRYAYYLEFFSTINAFVDLANNRHNGYSVRCVAGRE